MKKNIYFFFCFTVESKSTQVRLQLLKYFGKSFFVFIVNHKIRVVKTYVNPLSMNLHSSFPHITQTFYFKGILCRLMINVIVVG